MGKRTYYNNARRQKELVEKAMGRLRYKDFEAVKTNTVPCIYAALAIALHEKGWRHKRINDLFFRSQEIWEEYCNKPGNLADWCKELTGIDVVNGDYRDN